MRNKLTIWMSIMIYYSHIQVCSVVSRCLWIEIEETRTEATLFRRNSLATKMLDALISTSDGFQFGRENAFLAGVMPPIMNAIVANVSLCGKTGLEINPTRIASLDRELANGPQNVLSTTLTKHVNMIQDICKLCLDKMDQAILNLSPLKCMVLVHLVDDMANKFSREGGYRGQTSKDMLEARVISLLFLRSFCPELTKSDSCKRYAVSEITTKEALLVRRAQTLVAMVLQKMANNMRFKGDSSSYLLPMNNFIDIHQERLPQMYATIKARSNDLSSAGLDTAPIRDIDAALLYGDVDIEALASALHTLHKIVYAERVSFSEVGTAPFKKLMELLCHLDRPADRLVKMYGVRQDA